MHWKGNGKTHIHIQIKPMTSFKGTIGMIAVLILVFSLWPVKAYSVTIDNSNHSHDENAPTWANITNPITDRKRLQQNIFQHLGWDAKAMAMGTDHSSIFDTVAVSVQLAPLDLSINSPVVAPFKTPESVPVPVPVPTNVPDFSLSNAQLFFGRTITAPKNATVKVPIDVPVAAPIKVPIKVPVRAPANVFVKVPVVAPIKAPIKVPVKTTAKVPIKVPVATPIKVPIKVPVKVPAKVPFKVPVVTPINSSIKVQVPKNENFEPLLINVGGPDIVDVQGRRWKKDRYFRGGVAYTDGRLNVRGTQDHFLYQSERNGIFQYEIPVPVGNYEVTLHFAEIFFTSVGQRVFDIKVEGSNFFTSVDLVKLGGGKPWTAITLERAQVVSDGFLSMSFLETVPKKDNPSLAGIEIKLVGPHLAHATAGGPYIAVDTTNVGSAVVSVDGGLSHTHAPGETLTQFIWKKGTTIIGTGKGTTIKLPVGDHTITLTIIDSAGNQSTEETKVTIRSSAFPAIRSISPQNGSVTGNTKITISGSGFTYSASRTTVKFGLTKVSSSMVKIINANTIQVVSPVTTVGAPVLVTVKTPIGESNPITFTFVAAQPIVFSSSSLMSTNSPSVVAFGPDRRLYIGTSTGKIVRLSFVDGTFRVNGSIEVVVAKYRAILGLAFDPMDTSSSPRVYFSHSFFFHGNPTSSSGQSINGKVSVARGSNLEIVEDIVTGLPVSDHDHGVNGLEFGDNGELYIQIGGNTNAGIPGPMSGSQLQKENVLSAATLVAYLSHPKFDGRLRYDAPDDGNLVGGFGVEVFASGNRNPYGIMLHSNGYLYGTDNGMNDGYGAIQLGCNGELVPEMSQDDKINLLVKGAYYGHPNRKRGGKDSRQCVWHSPNERSNNGYTAPIAISPSSTDGLIEFKSNHFGGQLRGNLIVSQHQGGLYRVILSSDGRTVIPESNPPLPLIDGYGLSVTQAPSGELMEARINSNQIWYHVPVEPATTKMVVQSVFPNRGGTVGGSSLQIFGKHLIQSGVLPSVTVGGKSCPVTVAKEFRIQCTLPGGRRGVTVDVIVKLGAQTSTFKRGYRYIQGHS
jgi:glucose/arabinose dehydrogenase